MIHIIRFEFVCVTFEGKSGILANTTNWNYRDTTRTRCRGYMLYRTHVN